MDVIPESVEQISADWLRASAPPAAAGAFANLVSVRAERLGEGAGMLTNLHRLSLGYAPGAAAGPATLVAKLPSSVPGVLQMAEAWGLYEREVVFYREVAPTVGLRAPKAYVAEFDPRTQGFVLVMEDLAPAANGDQVAGLSLAQARLALEAIAGMHARWWDRPELAALEEAIPPFGEGLWKGTGAHLAGAWPAFQPFVASRASAALLGVGERLAPAIERLMGDLARGSRTLCHGDFRADNLMFAQGEHGEALVTFDWQVAVQARGALDVAQLLSQSITTDLRRTHEADLLRGYHDRLVAGGVEDYAYDAFLRDYRRALVICFFYVILPGASADMAHPRTLALYDSAVRRMDAVAQDHDLEAVLA